MQANRFLFVKEKMTKKKMTKKKSNFFSEMCLTIYPWSNILNLLRRSITVR